MEGTLCQAQRITQSEFGMHRKVARWATLCKGTQTQSSQLHSHQMEDTLCQALQITQSKFGMHRQVVRWATLFKGTQTQSPQLHSHQMEGTLCQAQGIKQSKFGMHRLNHVLLWQALSHNADSAPSISTHLHPNSYTICFAQCW